MLNFDDSQSEEQGSHGHGAEELLGDRQGLPGDRRRKPPNIPRSLSRIRSRISKRSRARAASKLPSSCRRNYVKAAYESFVTEATKLGEMYSDLAKSAYKPYEAPVAAATAKATKAAAVVAPAAA